MISAAVMCLAMNIYHEARSEPLAGQLAVGYSTMNRVSDERYPDTVCEVVYQAKYHAWDDKNPIRHMCQYSWFCDGIGDLPTDDQAMMDSTILAQQIYYGVGIDISGGATHYHATYVSPFWADDMEIVLTINQHIFYK